MFVLQRDRDRVGVSLVWVGEKSGDHLRNEEEEMASSVDYPLKIKLAACLPQSLFCFQSVFISPDS